MEQNTIQIQHINLECPIAEFGFNRFLLTFFIRYRVLNSNAFRPGIGPQCTLGLQPCSSITSRGHQIVGLQIVLRDQKSKEGFKYQSVEIYWSEISTVLGWPQARRLTKDQHQGNFSQHIYRYVSTCVSSSRWPPEPSNAPPTFFSLCSLWVLGTECSHSVYFFVFDVLVASSNITSHYIPQCTKKHISYSS